MNANKDNVTDGEEQNKTEGSRRWCKPTTERPFIFSKSIKNVKRDNVNIIKPRVT